MGSAYVGDAQFLQRFIVRGRDRLAVQGLPARVKDQRDQQIPLRLQPP
jgi:hypothetical protein